MQRIKEINKTTYRLLNKSSTAYFCGCRSLGKGWQSCLYTKINTVAGIIEYLANDCLYNAVKGYNEDNT